MESKKEATPPAPDTNGESRQEKDDDYSRSAKGKFRFKSSSSRSKSKREGDGDRGEDRHRRHRHRHHHHRSKRHKTDKDQLKRSPSPSLFEHQPKFSPDAAFRESLFDALGDDEGAEYWESVYGQPIHNYSIPSVPKGPNGELEQMSDEEYATYVRSRMWERTREGMLEEQERLRAERAKFKQRQQKSEREADERRQFERAMEESLQRGRKRRRLKAWKVIWEEYLQSWEDINKETATHKAADSSSNQSQDKALRNLLYWPVESGKRKDITPEAVEEFMRHAPVSESDEKNNGSSDLLTTLKSERIRWHPDKIQHRYSVLGIDDVVMRSVTEVFQIVDRMWNEMREKQG